MSKLGGYHENIGGYHDSYERYHDSYRVISRVHWGLGVVEVTGELIDTGHLFYILQPLVD